MNSALSSSPATSRRARLAWPHLILALLGLALSLYAIWAHGRIEAGQSTGCGLSESISCDAVIGSKWGQFFGIPLGYYGLFFWTVALLTAFSGPQVSLRSAALQRLIVAALGLATSVGLFVIAEFVIGKTCPICLSTHLASLLNFGFAVAGWKAAQRAPSSAPTARATAGA